MAGTLLLLFISLSITTNPFSNALAADSKCPPRRHCPVSAKANFLIVLGDSLFDVGFGIEELCLPSDHDPYRKKLNKPGRFSDGRTIPDFIAEYIFGAEERLVNPYSCKLADPESQFPENYKTLSFARAGAGVLDGIKGRGKTLMEQVNLFVELDNKINLFREDPKKKEDILYLISIGASDYLRQIGDKNRESIDPAKVVANIVENIMSAVKTINTQKGGRRFAFMNIGPLRYYPAVQNLKLCDDDLNLLDSWVQKHNEELQKALKDSQYSYSILDYHRIITNIRDNPGSHGLDTHTIIESACCGSGPLKAEGCGSLDQNGCGEHSLEDYVFFDGMHHTEHINDRLAKIFWNSEEWASPKNLKSIAGLEKNEFDFPDF